MNASPLENKERRSEILRYRTLSLCIKRWIALVYFNLSMSEFFSSPYPYFLTILFFSPRPVSTGWSKFGIMIVVILLAVGLFLQQWKWNNYRTLNLRYRLKKKNDPEHFC